jgi:hypothetical protein
MAMRAAVPPLLLLLLLTATAAADVHPVKGAQVSVDVPKAWSVDAKDDLLRAVSPDSAVAFVVMTVDTTDTKENLKLLEGELYSSISGLRWVDKVKKVKINKLPATWVEGAGANVQAHQLDVLVVIAGPTPAKKGALMFAVVEHAKLKDHKKTIQGIFQTLKPTKPATAATK